MYAFRDCRGLTSITILDSVTSIGSYAFSGCSRLTSIIIPDSVTSIGDYAFNGCSRLTSITIPDSVTSIGDSAFKNCSELTSVFWNAKNCTTAGSQDYPIFENCNNLTQVTVGENVKIIPSYTFYDCSGLTSITIPDSVTSIGNSAFSGRRKLGNIYITDVAAWCNISGLDNLMYYSSNNKKLYLNNELITSLIIPNSITSIGNSAFYGCSGLTSISIPDSVTSIGNSAFEGCSNLKTIYYKGDQSKWAKISIGYNNSNFTSATRYYYSETEPALNAAGTAYDGNYWHYDTDGTTPVIWKKEN